MLFSQLPSGRGEAFKDQPFGFREPVLVVVDLGEHPRDFQRLRVCRTSTFQDEVAGPLDVGRGLGVQSQGQIGRADGFADGRLDQRLADELARNPLGRPIQRGADFQVRIGLRTGLRLAARLGLSEDVVQEEVVDRLGDLLLGHRDGRGLPGRFFGAIGFPEQERDESKAPDQQHDGHRGPGVAPAPATEALRKPGSTRQDRPAVEEPTQVIRQFDRPSITSVRLLGQTRQADRLQVSRDSRLEPRGGDDLDFAHLLQRVNGRFPFERRPSGQQLEEDGPQGVDIRRRTDVFRVPSACSGDI